MIAAPLPLLLLLGADPVRDLAAAVERRVAAAESAGAVVGLEVRSLDSGEVLFARRAGAPLSAASNTKLVTTAAALLLLPPDFHFETRFETRGKVVGGALRGDLLARGGGDPCLSPRFFEGDFARIFAPLSERLREQGIGRIEGDLLLDDRLFDRQFVHPSWPREQLNQAYAPAVSALALNEGCVDVTVTPGMAGESASIALFPPGAPYAIEGRVATVAGKGKTLVHLAFSERGALRVRGEIAAGARPYAARVPVPDPPRFFGEVLREALRGRGIELAGSVRDCSEAEAVSPGWTTIHAIRSPLPPLLAFVNKRSDNFGAEHLLKTLGARSGGGGSWEAGIRAVRALLASRGIPLEGFAMEDGSGLSRGDRFPPSFLAALLESMWRGERRDDFLRTMAAPGEEGTTLERRLREEPFPRRVRAKTGYLSRVRALSGYARTRGEENLAFTILVSEEGKGSSGAVRELPDDLVRLLVDFARGGG